MVYREIIAGLSQILTKHVNILCGQNVVLVNVITGGTYWALRGAMYILNAWFNSTPQHGTHCSISFPLVIIEVNPPFMNSRASKALAARFESWCM